MMQTVLPVIIAQIVVSYFKKTGDGRKVFGDDILLRFRGPINTCSIMIKTTAFAVAPSEEKLSLRCWALFSMLGRPLVSRFMAIGSLGTHHNKHREHDYPVNSS